MKKLTSNPFILIVLVLIIIVLAVVLAENYFNGSVNINTIITGEQDQQTEKADSDGEGVFYAVVTQMQDGVILIKPGTINNNSFKAGDQEAYLTISNELSSKIKVGDVIRYTTDGAALITAKVMPKVQNLPSGGENL